MTTQHRQSLDVSDLYKSLPFRPGFKDVRLLRVQSGDTSLEDGGLLKGDLHLADLDQCPPFSALSYVWGVDCGSHMIQCGSFSVPVTKNCYSALQHLREKLGCFTIWVDAVCINQANVKEREQQMQLMRRIYSDAHVAYMWLGTGNDRSERAMEYLSRAGIFTQDEEVGNNHFNPGIGHRAAALSMMRSQWSTSVYPLPSKG
jgi:hypothetical protein